MNKFTLLLFTSLLAAGLRTNAQITIGTFAGKNINAFFSGASGTTAQLNNPWGVVWKNGFIYIADKDNNAIRKIDPSTGNMTTVAGCGIVGYTGDGASALNARLNGPYCLAVDNSGNMYISDQNNHCIRKVNTAGIISTIAGNGTAGSTGDGGPASSAKLNTPAGVFLDDTGNLYIADMGNNKVRRVSTTGIITTIAGTGGYGYTGDGSSALSATFKHPNSVALNRTGGVFIIDSGNSCIRQINSSGIINTIAGTGIAGYGGDGGAATSARLHGPVGIAFDDSDLLHFCDGHNNRVRKVTAAGIITTIAGTGAVGFAGDGGLATSANLNEPWGLCFDTSGNLYIADGYNQRIRKVDGSNLISTIGGNSGLTGDGGAAPNANLNYPVDVVKDNAGNVYIADKWARVVRKVDASNTITTYAGDGTSGNSGNGGPATAAKISTPVGLAVDKTGNLYIADQLNHNVRKVDAATGVISLVAGNGTLGYSGDNSAATTAQLDSPMGVAVDSMMNLYISDHGNNRIRMVNLSTGIITTYAGNGSPSFAGDAGAATAASLNHPAYIAIDRNNDLVIADRDNDRVRIVSHINNIISTIMGNGTRGAGGDGGAGSAAELCQPTGVVIDANNGVTVSGCNKIRHVPGGGRPPVRLDAGSGLVGMTNDGTRVDNAAFKEAGGLSFDSRGRMLIADPGNRSVRVASAPFELAVDPIEIRTKTLVVYPNPTNGTFSINLDAYHSGEISISILNTLGEVVFAETTVVTGITTHKEITLSNGLPTGVYFCKVSSGGDLTMHSFVLQK